MRATWMKVAWAIVMIAVLGGGFATESAAAKLNRGEHKLDGFHMRDPTPITLEGRKVEDISNPPPLPLDLPNQTRHENRAAASRLPAAGAAFANATSQIANPLSPPAGCTPPGLVNQEVAETARGLQYDPIRMYEFVRNNIEFLPIAGQYRSALATMLDRKGTAADQVNLLLVLLRQACIQAEVRYGVIRMPGDRLANWLGILNNKNAIGRVLNLGNTASDLMGDQAVTTGVIRHMWVAATINGQVYEFDPSFKQNTINQRLDIAQVIGHDRSAFLNTLTSGASMGPDWGQNFNISAVENLLGTYASRLIQRIRTENADVPPAPGAAPGPASSRDIYGGATIKPLSATLGEPLPYEVLWANPFSDIPEAEKAIVEIKIGGASTALYAANMPTSRVVITYNSSNQPVISYEGATMATGSAGTPNQGQAVSLTWWLPSFEADPTVWAGESYSRDFYVTAPGTYAVLMLPGQTGRARVEWLRKRLNEFRQSGLADSSPEVKGQTLAMIGSTFMAQVSRAEDFGSSTGVHSRSDYLMGIAGEKASPPSVYVDLLTSVSITDENRIEPPTSNLNPAELASFKSGIAIGSLFEANILQQMQKVNALSTTALHTRVVSEGMRIFEAVPSNWASVRGQLTGYKPGDLASIDREIAAGRKVMVVQNGTYVLNDWRGTAWFSLASDTVTAAISGGMNGGYAAESKPADPVLATKAIEESRRPEAAPVSKDPVNLQTGDFLYNNQDLAIGGAMPLGLAIGRSYDGSQRFSDGVVGRGWSHALDLSVHSDSDGFEAMAGDNAIDGAAVAVAFTVGYDMALSDVNTPLPRWMSTVAAMAWAGKQWVNNAVVLQTPSGTKKFHRLPDGTYNPPNGDASTLERKPDGTYALHTADGSTATFNAAGKIATWKDRNNNTLTFAYGAGGKLSSVTDSVGHAFSFTYSGDTLVQVADNTGRNVRYGYTGKNLTSFTDAAGAVTTYQYDSYDRLVKIFTPDRPTLPFVTNVYSSTGQVREQYDPNGKHYSMGFADKTRGVEVDPYGAATAYEYDSEGRTIKVTDALGRSKTTAYDALGRPVRSLAPDGIAMVVDYDARHNPITTTIIANDGSPPLVTHKAFDATFNQVVSVTDARGAVTTNTIDPANGNVLQTVLPMIGGVSARTIYAYNARGQLLDVTAPDGMVTANTYDPANGNLLSSTVDAGRLALTSSFAYDAVGNGISSTDPLGRVTTVQYDAMRRPTQVTRPAGAATVTTYDPVGRILQVDRATGDPAKPWQTTKATYTPTGKPATKTDAAGYVTSYTYDEADRPRTVTDPENRTRTTEYDPAGQVLRVIDAKGQVERTYSYTAAGKVATLTDARNSATGYAYDGYGRPQRVTYADGSYEETGYDSNGNPLTQRRRDGRLIVTAFDALNRRTAKAAPGLPTVSYAYDPAGRLASVTDPTGDGYLYYYDTAGRNDWVSEYGVWTYRSYDAANNRASVEIYGDIRTDYYYDDLDRMTHVFHNGATLLYSVYDPLGRRRSTMTDNGVFRQLTYTANDDVALVQQVATGNQTNVLYGYNKAHQITATTVTNPAHAWAPTAASNTSYAANTLNQYTAVGPLTPSYDANGNLTGDGVTSYGYDVENRLVSVSRAGMTASYTYDVLGRRHSKTVNSVTTVYLHDGDREIAELDTGGTILRRYVHAAGLDEVVAVIETGGTRRFLHRDALGSVMAVTDAGGTVTERYAYGPFGESAVLTGTPWRFAGQRLDPESGLYYMRGRHYNPMLGRFVQPDPIGYEGGLNLYAYVNNDPLNLTDPMGTEPSGSKSASLLERLRPAMELASMDGGPVSVVASAVLAVMDYGKGDVAGAGLNAMGALPLVGVAAGISKAGKVAGNAADAIKLGKSLASEQQAAELLTNGGVAIAGAGTKAPLRDAGRLANTYGGQAEDWSKVSSTTQYNAADGVKFETHGYRNEQIGLTTELKTKFP